MLEKIKSIFRRLKKASPGNRFQNYHQKEKDGGPDWKQNAYIILGFLLIGAGILLSIPPGVPGFVIVIVGCAIIAARSRVLAKALDRIELELRKLVHKLRYSDN
jgi:hypothetical protein